ncbi:virulence associated secretory protein [Salmonella enterica subsp. enterica]|uniref:Virulence associated secretory protein n=1 Tax=Salmonella enterica I TaxID=59201 RepID=A0A447TWN3_SALET|nr:virulence associated secretory protein [Salmonella enterica subsp. enterica]
MVLRARGDACPRIKQKNRLKNGWKTPLKKGQSFKSKDLIIACLTLGGIAYLVSYGSFNEFMGIIKIIIADNFDQSMADYSLAVFGIGVKISDSIYAALLSVFRITGVITGRFCAGDRSIKA